MPVFEYRALNTSGKKKTGIIDAESLFSARTQLRQKDIFPISIKKITSETSDNTPLKPVIPGIHLFSRVRPSQTAAMTRQLATLLSSGFPLVSATSSLIIQTDSGRLKRVLSKVKDAMEEGQSFSQALAQYPSIFSPVYINIVHAGEASGTLDLVLERLADIMEKNEQTRKKIQASLAYPIFMAIAGFFVLLFLITYIVPGIIDIFDDMNQTLPAATQLLIFISSFFQSFWVGLMAIPVILYIILKSVRKTDKGLKITDQLIYLIPFLGKLLKKISVARLTRILGSLLANGVPMLTALEIAKATSGNIGMQERIGNAAKLVEQGSELAPAFENSRDFPFLAIQMIKVGEKSGRLEEMLEKTADLFDREIDTSLTTVTSLLEPFIILIMGVVVGFIVLSICLPIFDINQLAL